MSDDGLEIRWRGPKEWRPYRWPGSPLLSAEENKRVGFILRESKKLIRRTAFLAPDDYAFPKYLALVHQGEQKSYATRYKETLLIENIETIRSGMHGAQLLDHSTSDQKYDAVALIRPYVRLNTADPYYDTRLSYNLFHELETCHQGIYCLREVREAGR